MITSYSFGRIKIKGEEYRKDLLILPDGSIIHPWWRNTGHRLSLEDLGPVLGAGPDVLVIGTGAYGILKPEAGLAAALLEKGIELRCLPTKKAVAEYNTLSAEGKKAAAGFHLTC